jgi:hypothetical protein
MPSRIRLLAAASMTTSLALGIGVAPTVAAPTCTYTFPAAGGTYRETVSDGDVICGGPGPDHVLRMVGGTFRGARGHDVVRWMNGGTFKAGDGADLVARLHDGDVRGRRGRDRVTWMSGGMFEGGPGPDAVEVMKGGRFEGGPYDDLVLALIGGTFDGGDGIDEVPVCVDEPAAVHRNVDVASTHPCAGILLGHGAPVRGP